MGLCADLRQAAALNLDVDGGRAALGRPVGEPVEDGAQEGADLGGPVAARSMGALGAVSRVAPAFGSALTFAVVPDGQGQSRASAPGQLPLQDVRRCLELLRA